MRPTKRPIHFSVVFLGTLLLTSGCAGWAKSTTHKFLQGDFSVYSYDDELQNTYVRRSKNMQRICAGPTPDAVETTTDALIGDDSRVGAEGGIEDASGALGLGGRNPEVLITRELMYRACELSMNLEMNYQQAREIYSETLNAIQAIAGSQTGTGTSSVASAAVVPKLKLPKNPPKQVYVNRQSDSSDSSDSDDSDYSDSDSSDDDDSDSDDSDYSDSSDSDDSDDSDSSSDDDSDSDDSDYSDSDSSDSDASSDDTSDHSSDASSDDSSDYSDDSSDDSSDYSDDSDASSSSSDAGDSYDDYSDGSS